MNVYAAVDGGHICCMTALPTDRVVTLRQKLVHTLGMVRRFRLLAGCCVLSGNMTLEEAGLCDGCSLQLVWLPEDVFATASTDTTAAFWSLETGERVQLFEGHEDQVMWLCFSPDGQLLATASTDRTAKIWCADSGECLATLRGHKGPVFAVTFSPDAESVATCSHDKQIKVWDTKGRCLSTLSGHSKQIFSVAWAGDGRTLASSSDDATIRLWNIATQSCAKVIYGHTGAVYSVSISDVSRKLVSASEDCTAKTWCLDSGDGHPERSFVHEEWVRHAQFSPDASKVITSVSDHTAILWDALTCVSLMVFRGHTDWIRNASFSSDGQYVATSSKDACAKVWNLDGKCLRSVTGHNQWVRCVAFAPSGPLSDGRVHPIDICNEVSVLARRSATRM